MPEHYYQLASDNGEIRSSPPETTNSYILVGANDVMQFTGSPTNHSNGMTRGKRLLMSSQESSSCETELSERDAQKAKNRKYAKDSRERKNQKIERLEQTTRNQKCIIEIYKKIIVVYWKRLNPTAIPTWKHYCIPWYISTDDECVLRHEVECLLPTEDETLFEELGNNPFGKIIANNSTEQYQVNLPLPTNISFHNSEATMIPNFGSSPKCISNAAPSSDELKMNQNTDNPLSHDRNGYIQNPPHKLDFTIPTCNVQTISENLLPVPTLSGTLNDDLCGTVDERILNSLHTQSTQAPIVSDKTTNTVSYRQANPGMNATSSATSAENSIIIHQTKTFNEPLLAYNGNCKTSQETNTLDSDVDGAVANSQLNGSVISKPQYLSHNCFGSSGNGFNINKPESRGFVNKPENEYFYSGDNFLENVDDEPVNLSRVSSVENMPQEIPALEDLHSSLETV